MHKNLFNFLKRLVLSNKVQIAVGVVILGTLFTLWWCDKEIKQTTAPFVFDSTDGLPYNMVGVVLGTSEKMRGGYTNPYFTYRIAAAVELINTGKVEHLLVSGDNALMSYNEPRAMQRALMAAGVDSSRITLDYAGFRTFDSILRAREVFGQKSYTVISQKFHNERAIYIAKQAGLNVVGFNARDLVGARGWRTRLREKGARVKVFLDRLMGVEPRFLGEPVEID